jgi:hypothetical protein
LNKTLRKIASFNIVILILLLIFAIEAKAQTFQATLSSDFTFGTISQIGNPVQVSGLATSLNGVGIGLREVTVTLSTNEYDYIELFLVAPDGKTIQLADGRKAGDVGGNVGVNDVSGKFVFRMDQNLPMIRTWVSTATPPSGFQPDVTLNAMNNDQNPNGAWKLYGRTVASGGTTTITSWSITFSDNGISPAIDPNSNCANAIPLKNYKTTGDSIRSANYNYATYLSNMNAMGTCFTYSSKKLPVTAAWFSFIPWCADDIIRINANGKPHTSIVDGTCTSFTVRDCDSKMGLYEYKFGTNAPSLTPGKKYYIVFEGQNSYTDWFDIWWFPGTCPRSPVGMTSLAAGFDPLDGKISVNWKTSWEQNSENFEILYKKADWQEFRSAGIVKSTNSTSGSDYNFDFTPLEEGTFYIQVVQKDFDGAKEIFGPVSIKAETGIQESFRLIHNNNEKEIRLFTQKESEINLAFFTLTGKQISATTIQTISGWNKIKIPDVAPGIYFVRAADYTESHTLKFFAE